ncbi:MAG: hypothetical protein HC815_30875 [Richelia sp. RM1_1_1]|nr:hypothetical protein [Richelia sp. RM1_1_1]
MAYIYSVSDAFDTFCGQQPLKSNAKSLLLSAIARYVAKDWGFVYPKKEKRLSPKSKESLLKIMRSTPANQVIDIIQVFKARTEHLEAREISAYKCYIQKFYNWCEQEGLFTVEKVSENELVVQVYPSQSRRVGNHYKQKHKRHQSYSLMAKKAKTHELIYPEDFVNENLASQLESYKKYRERKGIAAMTIRDFELKNIMKVLGWLVRYKDVSLSSLSLESLITYVPLNEKVTREELNTAATKDMKLIKELVAFLEPNNKDVSILKVLRSSFLNVFYYLYRDDVGLHDEFFEYRDIPVYRRLKALVRTKEENEQPSEFYLENTVEWSEIRELFEYLRYLSIATHYDDGEKITKATDFQKSHHLQHFLILGLMALVPTDRARTYNELEIGRTIVYGLREEGKFIPCDRMKNLSKAKWYIHLNPKDFKTGAYYGDSWSPAILNKKFKDGTSFYEYIDLWISKYRNLRQVCDHQYFFRGERTYSKLGENSGHFSGTVTSIFEVHLGKSISPNKIRRAFATQEARVGTYEERVAGALARHHSLEVSDKIYNQQRQEEKMAPCEELIQKMFAD